MLQTKSLTFFYPSKSVGGAEFLYIRLAKYLSQKTNIRIYVFDYKDGFLRQGLTNTNVTIIDYDDTQTVQINYDTTLITPFNHIFKINHFKTGNHEVKLFLWSIHPTHFVNYFLTRKWFITQSKLQQISNCFDDLMNNGAMIYMDYPNFYENKVYMNFSVESSELPYLPICCDDYKGELRKSVSRETFNICWLGRIASDKFPSIKNFVDHLVRLSETTKEKIKLIIIGNGDDDVRLNSFLNKSGLKYERKNTITGDTLNQFLREEVDLGFAMGTSLLEFAKIKIPVVMTDILPQDKTITDNKFQWLFETTGYSMGSIYHTRNKYPHNIFELTDILFDKTRYDEVANNCYEYYVKHHSLNAIANKLLELTAKSNRTIDCDSIKKADALMNPWYFVLLKWVKNILIKG